jgi:hypothetical protein
MCNPIGGVPGEIDNRGNSRVSLPNFIAHDPLFETAHTVTFPTQPLLPQARVVGSEMLGSGIFSLSGAALHLWFPRPFENAGSFPAKFERRPPHHCWQTPAVSRHLQRRGDNFDMKFIEETNDPGQRAYDTKRRPQPPGPKAAGEGLAWRLRSEPPNPIPGFPGPRPEPDPDPGPESPSPPLPGAQPGPDVFPTPSPEPLPGI